MYSPKSSQMEATLRVVRYVKSSPGLGILMKVADCVTLKAFCDADWASCPNTRRSITDYFVKFDSYLVSWKSKNQSTISKNSAEAEYRSSAATVADLVWMISLYKSIGVEVQLHVLIHCDSKSAIQIATTPVFHEHTKFIDIDCHFIRENVQLKLVQLFYLASSEQHADILTKALTHMQHGYLLSKLGIKNIFITPGLRGC
ncbi:hypothetical protein RND71_004010 [Anisodus tanguticus]|uniref:Uncharacterized protein n=1 Tax=Anisodus tanguticus TaxID=243964 RepID=A0AAE1SVN4_9SOLA|nr:hypothetical protein RND71_004010 [Anisodus tanguticus]